jgi:hypothetical protein
MVGLLLKTLLLPSVGFLKEPLPLLLVHNSPLSVTTHSSQTKVEKLREGYWIEKSSEITCRVAEQNGIISSLANVLGLNRQIECQNMCHINVRIYVK